MKHYRIFILSTMSFLWVMHSSCQNAKDSNIKKLSANEFESTLALDSNMQLIDVRTPEEFNQGFIKNAKNINWNGSNFETEVNKLDKSKAVFVYCLAGGRSGEAANKLKDLGFTIIYDLKGGMNAWRNANKHIEIKNAALVKEKKIEISIADFNSTIKSGLVLVDVYATWCGPCKIMAPYIDEIVNEKKDVLKFLKIDNDKNSELVNFLNVDELPTIIIFKNGKRVFTSIGLIKKEDLVKEIEKNL
jgi:thioredoxin 1